MLRLLSAPAPVDTSRSEAATNRPNGLWTAGYGTAKVVSPGSAGRGSHFERVGALSDAGPSDGAHSTRACLYHLTSWSPSHSSSNPAPPSPLSCHTRAVGGNARRQRAEQGSSLAGARPARRPKRRPDRPRVTEGDPHATELWVMRPRQRTRARPPRAPSACEPRAVRQMPTRSARRASSSSRPSGDR